MYIFQQMVNGRPINYKCIIATNNFMCVIRICRLYNMEENVYPPVVEVGLCQTLHEKCESIT